MPESRFLDHYNVYFNIRKIQINTVAEELRDPYVELGSQLVIDPLTEQVFVLSLKKIKKDKSCGPDGIPGEVFLN